MYSRSSLRCVIRFAVICTILCATLVVLAGISAVAVRTSKALPVDGVSNSTADVVEAQPVSPMPKNGRLAQLLASTIKITESPAFEPVRATAADVDRFYRTVTAAVPMLPSSELGYLDSTRQPESTIELQIPETPVSAPQPQAPAPSKPKPQSPTVTPAAAPSALDEGQITGLKSRLRLTPDQIEYWPAVEDALRDVARTHLRQAGKKHAGSKINIDVNSPEVQKLIWAAMPLLMRLRSDQKNEVRKLARIIGLEQVASQI